MTYPSNAGVTRLASLLLLAAATLLTGCGEFFTPVNNNPGGTGTTSYLYVTNLTGPSSGTIAAYSLISGTLTELSGSPYTLPAAPTSIVVAPDDEFLYVATNLGIYLYTINSDGTLTEGNADTIVYASPVASSQPISMVMDSSSSWLIIANQNSNQLDALGVDPTTGIPPVAAYSAKLKYSSPVQVAISPDSTSVAVALGASGIENLTFNPKATNASPWATSATLASLATGSTAANTVAYDTTSAFLYIGESTSNATADTLRKITVTSLGGTLSEVDYPAGKDPISILAELSGAYVYVANATDNSLSGFSVSAGALTAIGSSPYATAKIPAGLVEDKSKSYLAVAGSGSNPDLWIYNFDSTTNDGTLDVKTTTSTGTASPSGANAIAITH